MNSKRWKQLVLSRGRSFIFSTAIPVPVVAATLGKDFYTLLCQQFACSVLVLCNMR